MSYADKCFLHSESLFEVDEEDPATAASGGEADALCMRTTDGFKAGSSPQHCESLVPERK